MTNRRGDWRDVLSAYHLALKGNKVWVGFLALLYVVFILTLATGLYSLFADWGLMKAPDAGVVELGRIGSSQARSFLSLIATGECRTAVVRLLPLLNPFHNADLGHLFVSSLTFVALFWALSGSGGVIARLTALEYARDDFPTLGEARNLVRSKRLDYFLAFLWPFLFIVVPSLCNALIGLFCSIPYVGRILLVPLYVVAGLLGAVAWLFAIGWGLSFGLMMPAVSVGGKDAFDGWSTSYAYVLWQFGRFVCYVVVAGVLGVLAVGAAGLAIEALIYLIHQTIETGFVSGTPWLHYEFGGGIGAVMWSEGGLAAVVSSIIALFTIALRAIPASYAVAYFFTANTVIFFLLRKHVDNIEIEEIYEPEEAEEEFPPEAPEQPPVPGAEPEPEAAPEEEEPEAPEAEAEEEEAEEEAEAPEAEAEEEEAEEEAPEEPAEEEEPEEEEEEKED